MSTLPPENVGWLAGLRDDNIGRVLGKLHDLPEHGWSLDELARGGHVALRDALLRQQLAGAAQLLGEVFQLR